MVADHIALVVEEHHIVAVAVADCTVAEVVVHIAVEDLRSLAVVEEHRPVSRQGLKKLILK